MCKKITPYTFFNNICHVELENGTLLSLCWNNLNFNLLYNHGIAFLQSC